MFRSLVPRAYLASLLLAFVAGCGSSSSDTPQGTAGQPDGKGAPADAAAAAAPSGDTGAKSVATAASTTGGMKLSGRVVLDGKPPERRVIDTSKEAMCKKLHGDQPVLDEDVLVGEGGGVKNAFVYIRRGVPQGNYPTPSEPASLDQKNCMYTPRVQGIRVGQKLMVGNGDPVTHNVRSFPIKSRPFNFGQPPGSEPRERIFEAAEREIEVQCDIHPWMHAYLFVMEHPFYAVSGDDGTYAIEGLPKGEYTLAIWHEKFGRQQQTVTVGDSPLADVNFTFKP